LSGQASFCSRQRLIFLNISSVALGACLPLARRDSLLFARRHSPRVLLPSYTLRMAACCNIGTWHRYRATRCKTRGLASYRTWRENPLSTAWARAWRRISAAGLSLRRYSPTPEPPGTAAYGTCLSASTRALHAASTTRLALPSTNYSTAAAAACYCRGCTYGISSGIHELFVATRGLPTTGEPLPVELHHMNARGGCHRLETPLPGGHRLTLSHSHPPVHITDINAWRSRRTPHIIPVDGPRTWI